MSIKLFLFLRPTLMAQKECGRTMYSSKIDYWNFSPVTIFHLPFGQCSHSTRVMLNLFRLFYRGLTMHLSSKSHLLNGMCCEKWIEMKSLWQKVNLFFPELSDMIMNACWIFWFEGERQKSSFICKRRIVCIVPINGF